MKLNIEELELKPSEEIQLILAGITESIDTITLSGNFGNNGALNYNFLFNSKVAKALFYLPKTVNHFIFEAEYVYGTHSYEEATGRQEYKPWQGNVNTYVTRTTASQQISLDLKHYLAALPLTVHQVTLTFTKSTGHGHSTALDNLATVISYLPKQVHILTLTTFPESLYKESLDLSALVAFGQAIPRTLHSLEIIDAPMGYYFKYLPIDLELLHLPGLRFNQTHQNDPVQFLTSIPKNISYLDMSNNEFFSRANALEIIKLLEILAKLPLKTLCLRGNHLFRFSYQEWQAIMQALPKVENLELGNNGLLALEENISKAFMNAVPTIVKSIELVQKKSGLSLDVLKERCQDFPRYATTLRVKEHRWGLSVDDFLDVLGYLPDNYVHLDLSEVLSDLSYEEQQRLLAGIPKSFYKLSLRHNHLAQHDEADLQNLFATIAAHIKILDIRNNGFENSSYAKRLAFGRLLPVTITHVIVGQNELKLRNDGVLVPKSIQKLDNQSNTPLGLRRNHHLAVLLVIMRQLERRLNFDVILYILSFVLGKTDKQMYAIGQRLLAFPMSSIRPKFILPMHEQECLEAISQRITQLKPNAVSLDLSHCGLNRLKSETKQAAFIQKLHQLPLSVTQINLRGNGFCTDSSSQAIFKQLIAQFPKTINTVDLSANGFELATKEQLAILWQPLPVVIQLIILKHQALSPNEHLAQRVWPASYLKIVNQRLPGVSPVQALLRDYIKFNTGLSLWIYGHWNRHYVDVISHLLFYVDKKLMSETELQEELGNMNLINPTGSLARRLSFLAHYQSQQGNLARENTLANESLNDDDGYRL